MLLLVTNQGGSRGNTQESFALPIAYTSAGVGIAGYSRNNSGIEVAILNRTNLSYKVHFNESGGSTAFISIGI